MNFQYPISKHKGRRGFTLVEMLVAVAVFMIIVAIGVGGFARALRTQREVAALIAAQSNASLALEQMAREIRTGYLFCNDPDPLRNGSPNFACFPHCTVATLGTTPTFTCDGFLDFYNANSENVEYATSTGNSLMRNENSAGFVPITGDNVSIKYLTFTIFGMKEGDNWPPRVTISMGVTPSTTDPAVANDVINLQTTVSARQIDCGPVGSGGRLEC